MKSIMFMAACILMLCSCKNAAADNNAGTTDDCTPIDPTGILYLGTYQEVVTDGSDAQLKMWAWEDELNIKLDSFFEERMTVIGRIDQSKAELVGDNGVRLPITLRVMRDGNEIAQDEVILNLTKSDDNLYKLHVDFVNEPSETEVTNLLVDYTMFLTDPNVGHIADALPFNIDKNNISLRGMLPELNKYLLVPELWNIVNYINRGEDVSNLGDTEQIRIDERDRFFSYAFGEMNVNMEGRYFRTADGKIMIVLDRHDATYEFDQDLHIYIIDPAEGTIIEEEAYNIFPKQYIDANGIFQLRRNTDGVATVYDDPNGGLGVKILKLNDNRFN